MSAYYMVLGVVLMRDGRGHFILANCRLCQILFLTSSSNRYRRDLFCPFGCREADQRRRSHERSRSYYQSPEGKQAKRLLNQRRYLQRAKEEKKETSSSYEGDSFLDYLRFVVEGIEGRRISRGEIQELRDRWKKGRQRGLLTEKDLEDDADG
jgi:hypothetical protein